MIRPQDIDIQKIMLERINQGLSVAELAKRAGLGKNTITKLEHQVVTPRLHTLGKIARALGKSIEDFKKE